MHESSPVAAALFFYSISLIATYEHRLIGLCAKKVVFSSKYNTRYFSKNRQLFPQKQIAVHYKCYQINTNKKRLFYHRNCLLIKSF